VTRVLIITGDPIGAKMAGPAIRSWNMASLLAAIHEVTLVTTTLLEPVEAPFAVRRVQPGENSEFAELERWADVIVFQGHAMDQFEALRTTRKIVVVDIYDPLHLEMLEQGRELPFATWELRVATATRVLNQQLAYGDFFLCSSERQRAFYLGQLAALGRVNPKNYAQDPHLRGLIDVAPFGMSSTPPQHARPALRGVIPGIGKSDKILIWGGGVYNWFDPKSLIRAVAELATRHSDVRLYFLGTKHPGVEQMGIVKESLDLAKELGVLNSAVFFNEDWVDYSDRQNYLVEADAGVSTHFSHVETTFSFRTRILDYLWAGLPMVVTDGDSFAELVERHGLGVVVPPEDTQALANGLELVLYDDKFSAKAAERVREISGDFTWERTLAPLVAFVENPRHAADYSGSRTGAMLTVDSAARPYGFRHDLAMAFHHLKNSGVRATAAKVVRRLRRR
jgi:glycosyltransferase involved in cell wall biosynthesis